MKLFENGQIEEVLDYLAIYKDSLSDDVEMRHSGWSNLSCRMERSELVSPTA